MIKFEFNGRPFSPKSFEDSLMQAAMEAVVGHVREKIGAIRLPETGEFPTVVVSATSLSDIQYRVEGSPELLALVRERLALTSADEAEECEALEMPAPKVFLSYAWEDRELAAQIAHALQANGIDTWWAEWCMSAGDSLRQKIDAGLQGCTHFVVLLSPTALTKPWVNQEMDAGLMRKLRSQARFIPLRHQLSAERLPALLSGMLSPAIEDVGKDIGQLINDIYGVNKKPALGKAPAVVTIHNGHSTGYSASVNAVAKAFVEGTRTARKFDPMLSLEELAKLTGLSKEDITDAVHELRGMAELRAGDRVWPEDELFATFDGYWMPWNPANDALQLAADMLNDDSFPNSPAEIGLRYGWDPRRLNPAMAYLINRHVVRGLKAMDGRDWLVALIQRTDATRRFVKSRA